MSEEEFKSYVKVKLNKDHGVGKRFTCNVGVKNLVEFTIDDETEDPNEMLGPDPSRLLTSAILGCLSASYIFCLQKKELNYENNLEYEAEAEYISTKNEEGLWRVKEINVKLHPTSKDGDIVKRLKQCTKMFERTCTVTQSVRAGVKVNVEVDV